MTDDEVQTLFDTADARVELIRSRGRKGVLAVLRDAAILRTMYGFGLRRREAAMLDLADFRRNARATRTTAGSARYRSATARPRGAARRSDAPC